MAIASVEVFGGGILGLAVAYACAKRGARVRVIEKRHVGAGASGGLLGALAPHTPDNWNEKKQYQFESLMLAESWWTEAAGIGGVSPDYRRNGRIQPIANQRSLGLAKQRQAEARRRWNGFAEWRVQNVSGDWAPISATGFSVVDTLSASINPMKALQCLAGAVEALSGEILEGVTVGDGAEFTVHATGFEGLVALNNSLGADFGGGEKGQAALLACDEVTGPQIFADGIHAVPQSGGAVAVGSTSERQHDGARATDARLDELIARARRLIPGLSGAPVIGRWAGIRPRPSTRSPWLGPYPGRPGHFVANGGFKIGFGLAPMIGETLADLMLQGQCRIPRAFFPRTARFRNDSRSQPRP